LLAHQNVAINLPYINQVVTHLKEKNWPTGSEMFGSISVLSSVPRNY